MENTNTITIDATPTKRGKFLVTDAGKPVDHRDSHLYLTPQGALDRYGNPVVNSTAIMAVANEMGLVSPTAEYWAEKMEAFSVSEKKRILALGEPTPMEEFFRGETLHGWDYPANHNGKSKADVYGEYLRQWMEWPPPKAWFNAWERALPFS